MLQIATFRLPDDQDKANEFLKTHKPTGEIAFNQDMIFVAFEDGSYPPEYEISDLNELIVSNRNATLQQKVALHVLDYELADLNAKHNKGQYEQLTSARLNTQRAINIQEAKAGFLQKRIAELRAQ